MNLRILMAGSFATAMVLIPAAADAKGVAEVTVSGPNLATPMKLGAEGAGNLAQAAGLYRAFFETVPPTPVDPNPPSDDLGPRYVAIYTFVAPEQRSERRGTLRQELYPFAAGGAVAYTPPGQKLFNATSRGGWHRDARLTTILFAAGLPAPSPSPSVAVPTAVDATPGLTG
jgi:hypothetical protein